MDIYPNNIDYDIIISVLTYNKLDANRKFFECLYNNTQRTFFIVCLDNGSQDETPDFLKSLAGEHNNLHIILNDENIGIIDGRNYTYSIIREMDFKNVIFLDNDQFVDKGWDESYLEKMKSYDICGFEAWEMDDTCFPKRRVKKGENYSYVGCGGMMMSKKASESLWINDSCIFDPLFGKMYFEDPDVCWRASRLNLTVTWNEDSHISHKSTYFLNSEQMKHFRDGLENLRKRYKKPEKFSLTGENISLK